MKWILAVTLIFVGCSGNTESIAPAISTIAMTIVAIDPDSCDDIPFDDIRAANLMLTQAINNTEVICEAGGNPQFE